MIYGIVLGASVLLQFIAAFMALRLSKVTGVSKAWIFVSLAMCLMGLRRSMSLFYLISGSQAPTRDLLYESIGLAGSLLMLAGVTWIAPLFYSIKRTGEALKYRFDIEKVISKISADFINISPDSTDKKINRALSEIGEFAGVDRTYMFLTNEDGTLMSNTHEWCKKGIGPQMEHLQKVPVNSLPWFEKKIKDLETVYIPDIALLPPEADTEKNHFTEQGIKSLVVVPIVFRESLFGFLGFDSVRAEKKWIDEDIRLLKILGEIFLSAIRRTVATQEREKLIIELRDALSKVKVLSGFLPICSSCKKIRDDKGYWSQIELYIRSHSDAEFTHSI
jgi:hypothetical protein